MKKILIFTSIILFTFILVGCTLDTSSTTTTTNITDETTTSSTLSSLNTTTSSSSTSETTYTTADNVLIDLYSINDFHGGAYSSIDTLSLMSEYLVRAKASNPYSIFLGSGDLLQGTAFSNYYYGQPIVEILDEVGFSGFTLGNHEFDWGIETIANYSDGNDSNGEVSYPFLAANIVYIDSGEPLGFTAPYVIEEINGVKIGIIGVIGDVINSISASRVENIEFLDPADTVYKYADILRNDEDCDVVIVSIHDYNTSMNAEIANFTGTHFVDAIFNGHSHTNVADYINRSGVKLPYAQASNYTNSLLAKITLVYNYPTSSVTAAYSSIISIDDLDGDNPAVSAIINTYESDSLYNAFVTEILATTEDYIYKSDLAPWGASVIRDYMKVDFGILNSGGFRVNIESGDITMGDMVEVYPFDNYLKKVELTGLDLTELYFSGYDVVFDDSITSSGGNIYKNGVLIEDSTYYSVAAVDYVFDKTYYPFLSGRNIEQTSILMRDLLVYDLRNTDGDFHPSNGTSYTSVPGLSFYDQYYYRSMKESIL